MPAYYKDGKLVSSGDVGTPGGSLPSKGTSDPRSSQMASVVNAQRESMVDKTKDFLKNMFAPKQPETFADKLQSILRGGGLYSQNPAVQKLRDEYGLSEGDIIDLRLGTSKPGFKDKLKGVFEKANDAMSAPGPDLDARLVYDQYYKEGMLPSDYMTMPGYENVGGISNFMSSRGILAGINKLFGSPMGQRGLYYGREELGLEGDALKEFAGAVANNPALYSEMMNTPKMREYDAQEFSYDIDKDLQKLRSGPRPIAEKDEGFNPYLNPYLYDFEI